MATHSIILAWRITWTEEPRKLQSIGSSDGLIPSNYSELLSSSNTLGIIFKLDIKTLQFLKNLIININEGNFV